MPEPPQLVLLDACCAINLLATGAVEEILDGLPYRFAVTELVLESEILFVRSAEEAHEAAGEAVDVAQESRDLRPLVEAGLVRVLKLDLDEEVATFVDLALELDDGEAETAAVAIHRGGAVATDDRKAIRLLTRRAPSVPLFRTSALLREWSEAKGISDERVRQILRHIERLASFAPPRSDPDRAWWTGLIG